MASLSLPEVTVALAFLLMIFSGVLLRLLGYPYARGLIALHTFLGIGFIGALYWWWQPATTWPQLTASWQRLWLIVTVLVVAALTSGGWMNYKNKRVHGAASVHFLASVLLFILLVAWAISLH